MALSTCNINLNIVDYSAVKKYYNGKYARLTYLTEPMCVSLKSNSFSVDQTNTYITIALSSPDALFFRQLDRQTQEEFENLNLRFIPTVDDNRLLNAKIDPSMTCEVTELQTGNRLQCIMECVGIWFKPESYGLAWKVTQLQTKQTQSQFVEDSDSEDEIIEDLDILD